MDTTVFLTTAAGAARTAGSLIAANLGRLSRDDISLKQASDFVTRVDRESETTIIRILKEKFPDHAVLAEESAHDIGSSGYLWIIDPLDGTTNFIHTYPVFSVSIALSHEGIVIVAVIYDPLRDELFHAGRSKGAFANGMRISVSSVTSMAESLITTGFPFRVKERLDDYLRLFRRVFNRVSDLRRAGSAALDLAYVAAGRCEGFFELGLSPWDIAAGSLLIEEAGGRITDFGGGPDFLVSGNVIAGTPLIHKELLRETRAVFGNIIQR